MQRLGYTPQQIHAVTTGLASNANPGLLQRVINSVADAAPAVAPELPGIFSRFAGATSLFDTSPSELPKSDVTPADTTKDTTKGTPPDTSVRDTSRDTTKDTTTDTTPRDVLPKRDIIPRIATPGVTGAGVSDLLGIGSILDFLKFIGWLFHPLNLLRAVEFLTGLAFVFYGINVLMHGMRRSAATHRTTVGGTIRSLFHKTPVGRAAQVRRARRRGRRAGEIQAERDVAYRGARQERARGVGAGQRTTPGSGTGGTGQGSSALE